MRSSSRILAGLLLSACLFAPRAARAAVTGSIEGTVTDQATAKAARRRHRHSHLAGAPGRADRVHRQRRPLHHHRAAARRVPGPLLLLQHHRRAARRVSADRQDALGQRRHPDAEGGGQGLPHPGEGADGRRRQHAAADRGDQRARAQHAGRRPHLRGGADAGAGRRHRQRQRRRLLVQRRDRPREQLPHRRRQHHRSRRSACSRRS